MFRGKFTPIEAAIHAGDVGVGGMRGAGSTARAFGVGATRNMTWPSVVDNAFMHKRGLGMMAGGTALVGAAAGLARRHMNSGRSSGTNGLQGRSSGGMM